MKLGITELREEWGKRAFADGVIAGIFFGIMISGAVLQWVGIGLYRYAIAAAVIPGVGIVGWIMKIRRKRRSEGRSNGQPPAPC